MAIAKSLVRNAFLATAAVALVAAVPAQAGGKDALIGGIVGFGAGYITGKNANNRPKQRQRTTTKRRTVSPAQREAARQQKEENRKIQVTLAQLGCDPGTPDGVFGKRTRAAVRCFQEQFQQPVTGKLTSEQRLRLLITYDKVMAEPVIVKAPEPYMKPVNPGLVDQNPAVKPLDNKDDATVIANLKKQQADDENKNMRKVLQQLYENDGQDLPADMDDTDVVVDQRQQDRPAAESVTMVQYCDKQLAPAAASFTPAPTSDSDVMAKRFCTLQEAVVREAQAIEFAPGYSIEAMWNECISRTEQADALVTAVSTTGPGNLVTDLRATHKYSDASIQSAYKWCVAMAYRNNEPRVSLASALTLFAMKNHGYGELIAGHLALGFGTFANQGLAAKWLDITANSISENDPTIDRRPVNRAIDEMMAQIEILGSFETQYAQQRSVAYYNSVKIGADFDQIFNLTGDDIYGICSEVATLGDAAYGHDGVRQVFSRVCRVIGHSYSDDTLISIYDQPAAEPAARAKGDATFINHTTKTY